MKKITILTCFVLLLGCTLLAGCGAKNEETEEAQIPLFEDEREEAKYVTVKTPYGKLQYQERWEDVMITEQTEDGENLIVSFKAEINGETYQLFDVVIGECEEEAAATITADDGTTRNIYVWMYEAVKTPELTDSDMDQIYAMQEEINSIISFLE